MNLRHSFRQIGLVITAGAVFTACKKDDVVPNTGNGDDPSKEYKFMRVLVSDQTSNKLNLVEPFSGKVTTYDAKFPLATLYSSVSGRYAAVMYPSQNLVEVLDAGLEFHTDHIDVLHDPKWASITATGLRPAHFKSRGTEMLIFNDGDGTLSVASEADFNKPGARFDVINAGLQPHHGAMAHFANGTYAVTTAPASGAAPNRVQIISKSGAVVHPSTIEIGSIHGNASDGNVAVFGGFTSAAATEGAVLVVNASGEQRLIPNPQGFGAFRLANIYYAKSAQKFIGFVATKGAYMVNIAANTITPIYAGNDAFQCKVDYAGKNLHVLTSDGKLRVYDLTSGSLVKEGTVMSPINGSDTYKPVLEATDRYAYIAMPSSGEVLQVDLKDFSKVTRHKVSAAPVRLTLLGFESSVGHDG